MEEQWQHEAKAGLTSSLAGNRIGELFSALFFTVFPVWLTPYYLRTSEEKSSRANPVSSLCPVENK